MATHPHSFREPTHARVRDAHDARVRRWCWLALTGALLAAMYIGALAWATREIEDGVARSIQPLPVLMRDRPGTD